MNLNDLLTHLKATMDAHAPTLTPAASAIHSAQTDLLGALVAQVESMATTAIGSAIGEVATAKPVVDAVLAHVGPVLAGILDEADKLLRNLDAAVLSLEDKIKALNLPAAAVVDLTKTAP